MSYKLALGRALVLAGCAAAALVPAHGAPAAAPLTAPAQAPAPQGPAYTVRFTRPVKVGDRCRFVAHATVVRSMVANVSGRQRTIQPSSMSIHFEAVEEVRAVDATNQPTKATYTIEKCVGVDGTKKVVILEPNRVLTVEAGRWKSRLQVDQGALNLFEEASLRFMVSLPNVNDVNEDHCFGVARAVRVGESWPVNPEAVARLESSEGAKVNKQDVSGTVKLKAVQTVDGVPHLLLQGKVSVARWVPDARDLPANTQLVSGSVEVKFTRLIPAGASGPCVTDTSSERTVLKLRTKEDPIAADVLVDGNILRTSGIKRTPLSAAAAPDAPVVSGRE